MFSFKNISIGRKLTIIQVATAAGTVLLCIIAFLYIDSRFFLEFQEDKTRSTANIVSENCISPLLFQDNDAAQKTLQSLEVEEDITHALILDNSGKLFAKFQREGSIDMDFISMNIEDGIGTVINERFVFKVGIFDGEERVGDLWIQSNLEDLAERRGQYIKYGAIILVIGLLFAFVVAIFLQRSISSPIRSLANSMNIVARTGDYSSRIEDTRKDELGTLSRRFDQMLEFIHERDEALKAANLNLEERVAERTQELELINRELQNSTQELETFNKELEQYFYIFSHDLKTPLRAIYNLSVWIEEDLGGNLPEDVKEKLELLRERVNLFELLLNNLLEYSGIDRKAIEDEKFASGPIISATFEKLNISGNMKLEMEGEFPVLDQGKSMFQNAIRILVENSIKFSGEIKSTLRVSCSPEPNNYYCFMVTDEGPGIDPRYHEKVFRIFQTLHSKNSGMGQGAGLAIFQRIIRRMHGEINLNSQLKSGTQISFTWPGRSV